MSHTSFVDDVCSTVATAEPTQLPTMADNLNKQLDSAFDKHGFAQNVQKGVTIAKVFGKGSHCVMKSMAQDENIGLCDEARYLGPLLHWQGTNKNEIRMRRMQANRAFNAYRSLWASEVSMKHKLNVYQAAVLSILTSAITTMVLSKADIKALTVPYQKHLRRILQGSACTKVSCGSQDQASGTSHPIAMSYDQVCNELRVPSLETIIRIMRVRFLQNMCKDKDHHIMWWTAILGKYEWEHQPRSNPWSSQLCEDILAMSEVEDMSLVIDKLKPAYHKHGGLALRMVVASTEMRECLMKADLRVVKVQQSRSDLTNRHPPPQPIIEKSYANESLQAQGQIGAEALHPPPQSDENKNVSRYYTQVETQSGVSSESMNESAHVDANQDLTYEITQGKDGQEQYRCILLNDEGSQCGRVFEKIRGLKTHQARAHK